VNWAVALHVGTELAGLLVDDERLKFWLPWRIHLWLPDWFFLIPQLWGSFVNRSEVSFDVVLQPLQSGGHYGLIELIDVIGKFCCGRWCKEMKMDGCGKRQAARCLKVIV
jgi:hypothetical protein